MDRSIVWYGRPVRGCPALIAATVLSLVVSIHSPLAAAEPTEGGYGIVVFAVDPRSRDAQAMVDAVRAHLTGLPVRLVIQTEGDSGNASAANGGSHVLGTLTIDPGTPSEWVVSFTEPAIDTTLVRRIRIKPQGKAVALEEAAIVVRSMVEAILDGGHVGIARPTPPAGEDASRTGRGPRRGIAITGGFLGTSFGEQVGWQSGAQFGVRWQSSVLYAGLSYAILSAVEANAHGISLDINRYPGTIVLGYEGPSRLAPVIEVGFTVEYVRRKTIRAVGYNPTDDDNRLMFGVGAAAGASWSVLPRFRLTALVGADWMLNSYSYIAYDNIARPNTILEASPVRPRAMIGLGVDLW